MKTINLPEGVISSEIDIPNELIQNVKSVLSRSDFGSNIRYNNYLQVKNILKNFDLVQDDDTEIMAEKSDKDNS